MNLVPFILAAAVAAGAAWVPLHAQTALTTQTSARFSGSGNCTLCHASNGSANTSARGEDISQPTSWRSTMMALAGRDPYWQATVAAEAAQHAALASVIEDKCTNCHTPMGHVEAHDAGTQFYRLADARGDDLAMDGVSCTLCHQIEPEGLGEVPSFSGGYVISPRKVTYGPIQSPLVQPMAAVSGFEPVHAVHMEESALCATCHTLFTPFLDNAGNVAGEFPEQTPFLEWRESTARREGRTCQRCHIPALDEASAVSTLPGTAPLRQPRKQHQFVGGNVYMAGVIRMNAAELGATADAVHFDSTIARATRQLASAAALRGTATLPSADLLRVAVRVENLTGHKFPTGFPSRRAWVRLTVRDAGGRTVFASGTWNADGAIDGIDEQGVEPHHERSSRADDVQIYEAVTGDVDAKPTFSLLRAATYLKDNRIPPAGFSDEAMESDTIGIVGSARDDENFNRDGSPGSGTDDVLYEVTVDPDAGPYTVTVDLCYQSVKPGFFSHLAGFDLMETRRMEGYRQTAGNAPVIIGTLQLSTVTGQRHPGQPEDFDLGAAWPQPWSLSSGRAASIELRSAPGRIATVELVTVLGTVLHRMHRSVYASVERVTLPADGLRPGMYLCRVSSGEEVRIRPLVVTR